ncbi:hypothetical protein V6N11_014150 [Hibiscus sabdariffa]|uniref:Uncharacterized protein n=1 Tax=Hibiscus sabdariffa TaxID=183260 RepID=A0ABR2AH46_9ROSI
MKKSELRAGIIPFFSAAIHANLTSLTSETEKEKGAKRPFEVAKAYAKTTLQWFHSFLLYFWVNPTRMGIRGSAKQRAAPLCTFSEADQSGLEKGGELLTEAKEAVGMKEAGSYRF